MDDPFKRKINVNGIFDNKCDYFRFLFIKFHTVNIGIFIHSVYFVLMYFAFNFGTIYCNILTERARFIIITAAHSQRAPPSMSDSMFDIMILHIIFNSFYVQ